MTDMLHVASSAPGKKTEGGVGEADGRQIERKMCVCVCVVISSRGAKFGGMEVAGSCNQHHNTSEPTRRPPLLSHFHILPVNVSIHAATASVRRDGRHPDQTQRRRNKTNLTHP